MCDLGVSDSKSSHSYPFFSAYIVVWYFFGRNGVLCRVFWFYLSQSKFCFILLFPFWSLKLVGLGVGLGCWFRLLLLLCLAKESAFSFPSVPWCDGIQMVIICLWSLVSLVYVS